MSNQLTKEDLIEHIRYVREDLATLQEQLIAINGRTRVAERTIATLEERSSSGHGITPTSTAAAVGGGMAGVLYGLIETLRWMFGL